MTDSRSILDDEGQLFGLVNVVDALVVLLILAVVVAGVVLLLPSDGEAETRYVTLSLGDQPDFLAEEVGPGDEWEPEGTQHSLTITDVYRFNSADDGTSIIVRAEVNGTQFEPEEPDEEPVFEFLDSPLRTGRTLEIVTTEYEVEGAVTRVETAGETLPITESDVVLETSLEPATANEIEVGDQFTEGDAVFGEVTSIELFPQFEDGESDERFALVGITAKTIAREGSQFIGDSRVAVGQSLTFDGDSYSFTGNIIERGTNEITTESRQLVVQTQVSTTVANDMSGGDTFEINDVPLVTVESVTVYPTANPEVRRVVLGVSAKTRIDGGALLFGDRQLRIGSQLPIRTDSYDIQTEIIRRASLEQPGTQTTQTVTIQLDNIRPERANSLAPGLTEESRERTLAAVQDVSTQPAEIVLESESGDIFLREHPRNKDVELTVELSVRELDSGTIRYRGETLRVGQTVALELGPITVEGNVASFEE